VKAEAIPGKQVRLKGSHTVWLRHTEKRRHGKNAQHKNHTYLIEIASENIASLFFLKKSWFMRGSC